nr:glycosyltransferase [Ruegeria arenilitoris]
MPRPEVSNVSAPISIVIPTFDSQTELARSLMTLMEGLHAGLIRELVIADGGSTDHTLRIADEAGARIVAGAGSRTAQLRVGCDAAVGDWLLIIRPGTELEPGWTDAVAEHLVTQRPGVFRLGFRSSGLMPSLTAGWANLRSRVFGLASGDQGLLLPAQLYKAAGGYPDQPGKEEALMRSLPRATLLRARAITGAGRRGRTRPEAPPQ